MPKGLTRDCQRVVITGLGVASSLGCSVDEFWTRLLEGKSGVETITDIDLFDCRTRIGARVAGYDPGRHFSSKDLKRLSLTSQLALVAAAEAIRSAGLDVATCDPLDLGVILGGTSGGFVAVEPILHSFFIEKSIHNPLHVPMVMNNAPASNVSIRFGFKGPLLTI